MAKKPTKNRGPKTQKQGSHVQNTHNDLQSTSDPASQLELPEGYKLKKKKSRSHKKKTSKKWTPQSDKSSSRFQTQPTPPLVRPSDENIATMVRGRGALAGRSDYKLSPESQRTHGISVMHTRSNFNSMTNFFRVEGRKWKSLGTPAQAKEFLEFYDEFQRRKYDPEVFAVEKDVPIPTDENGCPIDFNALILKEGGIEKLQALRAQYYVDEKRVDKLRALEKNVNWPRDHGIVTKAPLVRMDTSEHTPHENRINHFTPIFRIMNVPEIAQRILSFVPNFVPLARFSQTCHTAFNIVSRNVEVWDLTSGNFLECEDHEERRAPSGLFRSPIVVTPVRKTMLPTDEKREENSSYSKEFDSTVKLFRALDYRANVITTLHLHRLSYLNVAGVDIILNSLPNLENLGVYQCPLLHFGKTEALLQKVQAHPKAEGRKYVNLDFFPMYHQGPNDAARHGSFGVTWGSAIGDTASGILKIVLYELYPLARALGINLFAWDNAFRLFLEKCPLPDWAVVKLYEAIRTFECKNGGRGFITDMSKYDDTVDKWKVLANEIAAAVIGDDFDPWIASTPYDSRLARMFRTLAPSNLIYRRDNLFWQRVERTVCCKKNVLWVFVPFAEGYCWGCVLNSFLNRQTDHHKSIKAQTANNWLAGSQKLTPGECKELDDPDKVNESDKSDSLDETDKAAETESTKPDNSNDLNGSNNLNEPDEPTAQRYAPIEPGDSWQMAHILPAMTLKDALHVRRIQTGSFLAQIADDIRIYDMKMDHKLQDEFLPLDPDNFSLERRYAKVHEPHPAIDRKYNDRQYKPVGSWDIAVTTSYYPKQSLFTFHEYHLGPLLLEFWDFYRAKLPEADEQEIMRRATKHWVDYSAQAEKAADVERQKLAKHLSDQHTIRHRFFTRHNHLHVPNRHQMEWDAMIMRKLGDRYPGWKATKVVVPPRRNLW